MAGRGLALSVAIAVLGCARICAAQEAPSPSNVARAVSLFEKAKAKLAAGETDAACALFVESHSIDPQVGTLLNAALCHEKAGKTATAWAEFTTVVSLATRAGQPKRVEFATEHVKKLEPTLPRVRFEIAEHDDALSLTVDGAPIRLDAARSGPIPIDPGDHVVRAVAPHKSAWETKLAVAAGPSLRSFTIPVLAPASEPSRGSGTAPPLATTSSGADAPREGSGSPLRPIAWGLAITAGVGLAVGVIGGAVAASAKGEADDGCTARACLTQEAFDADRRAHGWATVSTVGFVSAGVLAASAVVLFVLAPKSTDVATALERSSGTFRF